MKIQNKEIRSLLKSFVFALRGLWYCIKNERNMRIHITTALLVLPFALVYELELSQFAMLIVIIGFVMVCEVINTAIEALVNLGSPSYDSLARIAKDVAAGAVFLCAAVAVVVGVFLFANPIKLLNAVLTIITNPFLILLYIILISFGVIFVFKGVGKKPILKNKISEEVKIYKPKRNKVQIFNDSDQVKIYEAPKQESNEEQE